MNDNEKLSFISLAAATANVVRYLEQTKEPHPERERDAAENNEQGGKTAEHRKAIEHGLRQIENFERRYRAVK